MRYTVFIVFIVFNSCAITSNDEIVSTELISSKGERVYIISNNWGVTGDHQISTVTKNKDKLRDEILDTAGCIRGLNPFEYRFSNDTLTLYFRNKVRYHIKEQFETITIQYKIMGADYYRNRDTSFHSVPESEVQTASGMPKPGE